MDELLLSGEILLLREELALRGEIGWLGLEEVLRLGLQELRRTQRRSLPDDGTPGVCYAEGNWLSVGSITTN